MKTELSILIPIHNEAKTLPILAPRLVQVLKEMQCTWQVWYINDGSSDTTAALLKDLTFKYSNVYYHTLPFNMGQYEAIKQGFHLFKSKYVVIMDGDGQDRPEEIPNLYKKAKEGYDVVFAKRSQKAYGVDKVLLSMSFHWVLSRMTETVQDHQIAGFGIYSYSILVEKSKERYTIFYLPALCQWQNIKVTSIPVIHGRRLEGQSKYGLKKRVKLAWKILLEYGISF